MDEQLRKLERLASTGDVEAIQRLRSFRNRVNPRRPVELTFGETNCRSLEVIYLRPLMGNLEMGIFLPHWAVESGIVRKIAAITGSISNDDHQVVVYWKDDEKEIDAATINLWKSTTESTLEVEAKIPPDKDLGVKLVRQTHNDITRFTWVQVTLEVWLP
jgi:hypothetical protein